MRITGIDARLYRIPPAVQIEDSIQRISHWEFVVSIVTTDAGISGTGFAYTLGIGGTALRELVDTYLTPLVLGSDVRDVMLELSVHALCAVPNGLILEDLLGGSLSDLGLLEEPIRVVNGEIAPPACPGHGIVFDSAALQRYEVTGKVTGITPTRT